MTLPLFDSEARPDDSEAYLACRNHALKSCVRAGLEDTWARYGHLCPEAPAQFIPAFRREFHARAWELFLIRVLEDAGLSLERPPPHGPDICFRLASGLRCWIEAVVPGPGTGANAVFQRDPARPYVGGLGGHRSASSLLLRYCSILEDKRKKLDKYRSAGIVAFSDASMIAVYQGGILDAHVHDAELPALAKVVFGFGDPVWHVPIDSDEPPHVEVHAQTEVPKATGQQVSTTFFLDSETTFISGILFAREDIWNLK
jgi:hypothetical protein